MQRSPKVKQPIGEVQEGLVTSLCQDPSYLPLIILPPQMRSVIGSLHMAGTLLAKHLAPHLALVMCSVNPEYN